MLETAITARYRWTAEEMLRAEKWHLRHKVPRIVRNAAWVLRGLIMALVAAEIAIGWFLNAWQLLWPLVVLLGIRWALPRILVRQFARRTDKDLDLEWTASADGIRVRTALGQSEFGWALLVEVAENRDGFFVLLRAAGLPLAAAPCVRGRCRRRGVRQTRPWARAQVLLHRVSSLPGRLPLGTHGSEATRA